MSEPTDAPIDASTSAEPTDTAPSAADAIRADIEKTRAELADTVDALSDKLDLKGQVGAKVSDAKTSVSDAVSHAKAAAPRPVRDVLDTAGAKAGPVVHTASDAVRPYRKQLALGAALGFVVLIVVRRRRSGGKV